MAKVGPVSAVLFLTCAAAYAASTTTDESWPSLDAEGVDPTCQASEDCSLSLRQLRGELRRAVAGRHEHVAGEPPVATPTGKCCYWGSGCGDPKKVCNEDADHYCNNGDKTTCLVGCNGTLYCDWELSLGQLASKHKNVAGEPPVAASSATAPSAPVPNGKCCYWGSGCGDPKKVCNEDADHYCNNGGKTTCLVGCNGTFYCDWGLSLASKHENVVGEPPVAASSASSCAAHPGCVDLGLDSGECCPTADGTMLGCCAGAPSDKPPAPAPEPAAEPEAAPAPAPAPVPAAEPEASPAPAPVASSVPVPSGKCCYWGSGCSDPKKVCNEDADHYCNSGDKTTCLVGCNGTHYCDWE